MENHNDSRHGNGEEVGIIIAGRIAPYQSGVLPRDFPQRLERLREASGLTWNAFADAIGIDKKRVHRYREDVKPAKPDSGGFYALVKIAALIPGGPRHPHGRGIPGVPLAGLAGPAGLRPKCHASAPITGASDATPSRTTFPRPWNASRRLPA